MHPVRLEQLPDLFDKSGFCWAFMREPEVVLRDMETGSDVDIWFEQRALPPVAALLIQNGWHMIGGRSLGKPGNDSYNATLRFAHNELDQPILELFFGALRWRTLIYWNETCIAQDIDRRSGFPTFGKGTLLAVLLTRMVLRHELKGARLQRARAHLQQLSEPEIAEWRTRTIELLGPWCTDFIYKSVTHCSNSIAERVRFSAETVFRTRWKRHIAATALRRIYWLIRRQLIPGASCELIGTDGTGKSTLAKDISRLVNHYGYRSYLTYWGRTRGNIWLVRRLRKLSLSIVGSRPGRAHPSSPDRKQAGFLYKCITTAGALIYLAEYWVKYISQLYPRLHSRLIVLLDRGPTDFAVMKNTYSLSNHLYRIAPPVSLRLFMHAPARQIYRRKQERTIEEIQRQQDEYNRVCSDYSDKKAAITIDTTADRESNAIKCAGLLLSLLYVQNGSLDRDLFLTAGRSLSHETHADD